MATLLSLILAFSSFIGTATSTTGTTTTPSTGVVQPDGSSGPPPLGR